MQYCVLQQTSAECKAAYAYARTNDANGLLRHGKQSESS